MFIKTMKCIAVNKQINRAQVTLAENVKETEKEPTAKNVINLMFSDPKEAAEFEPGETYEIQISKQ